MTTDGVLLKILMNMFEIRDVVACRFTPNFFQAKFLAMPTNRLFTLSLLSLVYQWYAKFM